MRQRKLAASRAMVLCPGGCRANGTALVSFPLMTPLRGATRHLSGRQNAFRDPRDKCELRSPTPLDPAMVVLAGRIQRLARVGVLSKEVCDDCAFDDPAGR
jgi:hypothetical protein